MHTAAPDAEYVPVSQLANDVAPSGQLNPAGHMKHERAPEPGWYRPAGQSVQLLAVELDREEPDAQLVQLAAPAEE